MNCKDSDVFALEEYMERILNEGRWKSKKEIVEELKCVRDDNFKNWLRTNISYSQTYNNNNEELIEEVMIRLCELFPMKYTKKYVKSNLNVIQNNIVFEDKIKNKLYFKRNIGF